MQKNKMLTLILTASATLSFSHNTLAGGSCGTTDADCHWELVDGVLTITGNGTMNNYTWEEKYRYDGVDDWGDDIYTSLGDVSDAPWFDSKDSITSVVIGNDVKSVGNNAFWGLNAVEDVTIGNSVTSIGNEAFRGTAISQVTIPEGVTSIGDDAFEEISSLSSVNLPESLTSIGMNAFSRTSLENITIPENVTYVGRFAFADIQTLESIAILSNQANIDNSIFEYEEVRDLLNLPALTDITIPDNFSFGEVYTHNYTVKSLRALERLYDHDGEITYEEYEQLLSQAEAALANSGEFSFTISRPKSSSGVNIHCIGDMGKCAANIAAAGYEEGSYTLLQAPSRSTSTRIDLPDGSTKVIDADGKIHYEGKRIYTLKEANEVSAPTGNRVSLRYQ